jgi:hypothetical protein
MVTLQFEDNSSEPGAVVITTGEAGQMAHLSGERMRQLALTGELPSFRTAKGQWLFVVTDVHAFIERRQKARSGMAKNVAA